MAAYEYTAQAASTAVNGEVKLNVAENSFTVTSLFDVAEIPYAEVNEIVLADYIVTVKTDSGNYAFSRMGEWASRFHDSLCNAYNKAVLRSMFVKSKPAITATGDYSYIEGTNKAATAKTPLHIYENSVIALPLNLHARRIPLCFISGMDKGTYSLTLKLSTDESYTFARLGYDTAPFEEALEQNIRRMRERAMELVKDADTTLTPPQVSKLAAIMPEGASASFGQIAAIAPSFVSALEKRISRTRAGEYFDALGSVCDPARICIGFRKNDMNMIQAQDASPYMFWLAAPSPDGRFITVEFSEADTATFVYRTNGRYDAFIQQLNRALEAIAFKREVIGIPEADLRKPGYADYYMAAKRTAALQLVRRSFADRVIHSNPETWKNKLTEIWNRG